MLIDNTVARNTTPRLRSVYTTITRSEPALLVLKRAVWDPQGSSQLSKSEAAFRADVCSKSPERIAITTEMLRTLAETLIHLSSRC